MKPIRQLKSSDIPKLRKWILKKRQNNICLICKKPPVRPCLDHDHIKRTKGTGQIRGVLCSSCNVLIAKSENNCDRYGIAKIDLPNIMRSMADYLERKQYPYMHPSEKPKDPVLTRSSYNKLKKAYTGRAKFPDYRVNKNNKGIQKMTVKFQKLFDEYNIEPKFYK